MYEDCPQLQSHASKVESWMCRRSPARCSVLLLYAKSCLKLVLPSKVCKEILAVWFWKNCRKCTIFGCWSYFIVFTVTSDRTILAPKSGNVLKHFMYHSAIRTFLLNVFSQSGFVELNLLYALVYCLLLLSISVSMRVVWLWIVLLWALSQKT